MAAFDSTKEVVGSVGGLAAQSGMHPLRDGSRLADADRATNRGSPGETLVGSAAAPAALVALVERVDPLGNCSWLPLVQAPGLQ
jgi:hypothetical protein